MRTERRHHTCYSFARQAIFCTAEALEDTGEPVNVDVAGLLPRSEMAPAGETDLWVNFTAAGQPEEFVASGRVAHSHHDTFAVMFLEEPAGLGEFLKSQSPLSG